MRTLIAICILTFARSVLGDDVQSGMPSGEFYRIAADKCESGEEKVCSLLVKSCEKSNDAKACFHLAYAVGLRGDDEKGLKYLRLACDGGILEACRQIPVIKDYIKEKQDANKVVL